VKEILILIEKLIFNIPFQWIMGRRDGGIGQVGDIAEREKNASLLGPSIHSWHKTTSIVHANRGEDFKQMIKGLVPSYVL
jgi:hypothetical protein